MLKRSPGKMPLDPKIVAQYWIANWDESTERREKELSTWVSDVFYTAMDLDADYSMQLVEAIHAADPEQKFVEVFAAGPVEDLLAHHGPNVIDRIIEKARVDPTFAHVLGGVWQNSMLDEVWERVKVARVTTKWADPAP